MKTQWQNATENNHWGGWGRS